VKNLFLLSLLFCFASADVFSEVTLDNVFSSCMVLQQQKPVAFFGTASPGETVTVEFAGRKICAKAGSDADLYAMQFVPWEKEREIPVIPAKYELEMIMW